MEINFKNTLMETLGMSFPQLQKDKVIGRMPVDYRTKQIAGILHGGATAALLETVASIGAYLNLDMEKQEGFGVDLNISHLSSASSGAVIAEATPLRMGRSLHVWEVKIYEEGNENKIISAGRCSVFIRDKKLM